jgi:hypothetical protein
MYVYREIRYYGFAIKEFLRLSPINVCSVERRRFTDTARSIYRERTHVTELTVARGESDSSSRTSINAAAAISIDSER